MDVLHEEASTSSHIVKQITRDKPEIEANRAKTKPIFLSHSGMDKAFVMRLYHALRNAGHEPFLDTESLAPAEYFPPSLIESLRACKLGVVVLSPHFLTTKWPMRELHILHTSPSSPKILPLFHKVHPDDLKRSSPKFTDWQAAWQDIAEKDLPLANFNELEMAVEQLPKIQGVVHSDSTHFMAEEKYIEEVVLHVSRIIRPLLRYDISNLTGHERVTKEVDEIFRTMPVIDDAHQKARVVGFYGIGGQGKTTVCKLMVNNYASIYAGRCALIEFPTNDRNEKEVVSQCMKALNQLTSTSKAVTDRLYCFDQCLELMKQCLSGNMDVFIALDNIWEECLDFAQRILDLGFNSNSKILVTSRSSEVLLNLLQGRSNVMPLPSVNSEEARQMFVKCFNRNRSSAVRVQLQDAQVDDVIQSYRFNNVHHPLGIRALGVSLGRSARDDQSWFAAWKQYSHPQSAATDIIDVVNKAIKINFDSSPPKTRNIFLDIALIYIPHFQGCELNRINEILKQRLLLHKWLSALYQEMTEWEIRSTLDDLAYGGLLDFEESGGVHVHDLYRDLAIRKASASGSFLLVDHSSGHEGSRLDEGDHYTIRCGVTELSAIKEPGRIVLLTKMEDLRGCSMRKLGEIHLLSAPEFDLDRMFVREAMCSLRVLSLMRLGTPGYNWPILRDKHELSWLDLSDVVVHTQFLCDDIAKLSKLSFLSLNNLWIDGADNESERTMCLGGLVNLRVMVVKFRWQNHELGISGLGSLINLECMILCNLNVHMSILCLDGFVNLRVMIMEGILELQEISGLGSLMNLECMILRDLPMLRKVDGFSSGCSRLRDVQFCSCMCLTQVEGLGVLPNLQTLTCLIPALHQLEKLHDQSSHTSSASLQERNAYGIMKVRPYPGTVYSCTRRRQLMDVKVEVKVEIHALRNLKSLTIMDPGGNTGRLHFDGSVISSLRELVVKDMKNLEEISGLGSLMNFVECMILSGLPRLREVNGDNESCMSVLRTLHCEMHILNLLIENYADQMGSLQAVIVIAKLPRRGSSSVRLPSSRSPRALTFKDLVSEGLSNLKTFYTLHNWGQWDQILPGS